MEKQTLTACACSFACDRYDSCRRLVRRISRKQTQEKDLDNDAVVHVRLAAAGGASDPNGDPNARESEREAAEVEAEAEDQCMELDIVPISTRRSRHAFDVDSTLTPSSKAVLDLSPRRKQTLVAADSHQPLDRELATLFWRTWTDILRHPALLKLHVAVSLLVGTAGAIIFQNVPDDLSGLQNRAGFIFFTLTFFAFGSLTSIDLFISERSVCTRELQGNYYRVGTYFFAKATLDGLLLRVLPAVLYSLIVYWSIGLRSSSSHILVFFATLALFNLAAGALSMVIAVVSPTAGFASLATIVALLIGLLFGGFLANAGQCPHTSASLPLSLSFKPSSFQKIIEKAVLTFEI